MQRSKRFFVRWLALMIVMIASAVSLASSPGLADRRLPTVDYDALQQELARCKGNPVVLHLWAGWCGHCRAEFPKLVRLERAYRRKGVRFIAIAVDRPGDSKAVRTFLDTQKTAMTLFRKQYGSDSDFIESLDPDWTGELPYTRIYNREGDCTATLTGTRTYTAYRTALRSGMRRVAAQCQAGAATTRSAGLSSSSSGDR